ncbi:MAG: methyl-accepting chemotaxis protein [Nitrococcus sp.]|nr:methyl-accepting chemotaxis protein [Nitrococcus sp.]
MAFFVPNLLRQNAIDGAVADAKETVIQFKTVRKYYSENVVKKLANRGDIKFSATHQHNDELPLPATVILDMSDLLKDRGTTLKLYSPYPFPNRKDRTLDQFGQAAWTYLNNNPDGIYVRSVEVNGKDIVRVAMPDKMTSQSCVSCHNTRADSAKRDWQIGDLGGVLEIDSDISGALAGAARASRWVVLAVVGLALVVMGFAYYIFKKRITSPLSNASAVAKSISKGDLTISIDHVSHDEVGELLVSLSNMQNKLIDILGICRAARMPSPMVRTRFPAASTISPSEPKSRPRRSRRPLPVRSS